MNAKEKAIEIIESFRDGILDLTLFNENGVLVKCAIIHVKGIIDVIEDGNEFDYWQQVLTELKQM